MVKLLKTLLAYQLKQPKLSQKEGGFTLIEVLVGLVLAFLVILPLLGFMVNMLQTDRQEQAKASSEQEIQAALNYISRDLEQAVYIYDSFGLSKIQNYLPTSTNSQPVLVFWKRQFVSEVIPTGGTKKDDGFTYALVAYYLKTPTQAECTQANWRWSCTAQITRLLVRGDIKDKNNQPINNDNRAKADTGFNLFKPPSTGSSSVEDIMNAWISNGTITKTPEELIDYIDQTPVPAATPLCPAIERTTPAPAGSSLGYGPGGNQQVPSLTNIKVNGFYACVDVEKTTAQVFIRGNALARLQMKANPPIYANSRSVYFPKANIQVKGRGLFSTQQNDN